MPLFDLYIFSVVLKNHTHWPMRMYSVHTQRPGSTGKLSHLPHYHVINIAVLAQGWRHSYMLKIVSKQFTTKALQHALTSLEEGTHRRGTL